MSKKKDSEQLPKPLVIGLVAGAVIVFGGILFWMLGRGSSDVVYDPNYKLQETGKGRRAASPPGGFPSTGGNQTGQPYKQPENRPPGAGTPAFR